MPRLTLTQPDDWHVHLREGAYLSTTVAASAQSFARALVMPNLLPPVLTVEHALAYRRQISHALPPRSQFTPLMTLYLTEKTSVTDIIALKDSQWVIAVKYYPAGATTHSAAGVRQPKTLWPLFEAMQKYQVPLLVHGELPDPQIDFFDREKYFIDKVLVPIVDQFPSLRVVLEHITTQEAVEYVQSQTQRVAATITAHHLLMNRNALFNGGLQPHHYCLPVLKREAHRQALLVAATSGQSQFFLGTDSAPHPRDQKETACGCAGIYTAPGALALYAEAFEQVQALDKLEGFASFFGADFYGLPRNTTTITLEKRSWQMPAQLSLGDTQVIPLRAGQNLYWQQVSTL
ncbi:MAG: dihydroorotase [Pseudomonadota bacterium]|nr:dihydroorotase [Pseudomonadota bacterium]